MRLLEKLQHYLLKSLGVRIRVRPWQRQNELPFFLTDLYDFYETTLLKRPCLLMLVRENAQITPATVRKHFEQVFRFGPGFCIYVTQNISSHDRARLVKQQVPFIVPENQMYLPFLGIDFREYFKQPQEKSRKHLSPAAQAIVISFLVGKPIEKLTPSQFAKQLGYTLMTMKRAFDELKAAGIGEVHKKGRELFWIVEHKKNLWEQSKLLMQSPVKKRVWLKRIGSIKQSKILSGLSALAHYSYLNPSFLPIYAVNTDEWRILKLKKNEILSSSDDAIAEVEVWHYDPTLFEQDGVVDPYSLYLSLSEIQDERVEFALATMMEKIEWLRD